ncbi:MAG: inorganic diphosphatase [Flavisolibacter sp.]
MPNPSNQHIEVMVETPRGSRNKYAYDPGIKGFRLKKLLPSGQVFPFDFGFIPGTKGEDGDPLDVLIIMEEPAFPGILVRCRLIGALEARQSREKEMIRNDRLIAVSLASHQYEEVHSLGNLPPHLPEEMEHFFISYNQQEGKLFQPLGWADAAAALKLLEKGR